MLKFELIHYDNDFVLYRYFPDGATDYGEIEVNVKTGEISKEQLAPDDDFRWYFLKMYGRIKRFITKDNFDKEGIIAWY